MTEQDQANRMMDQINTGLNKIWSKPMTPDQMRIAIAENQGWKKSNYKSTSLTSSSETVYWEKDGRLEITERLPNYCADLNAMAEAEKTLEGIELHEYTVRLLEVCKASNSNSYCATALQRTEAYLRTKGLWKE